MGWLKFLNWIELSFRKRGTDNKQSEADSVYTDWTALEIRKQIPATKQFATSKTKGNKTTAHSQDEMTRFDIWGYSVIVESLKKVSNVLWTNQLSLVLYDGTYTLRKARNALHHTSQKCIQCWLSNYCNVSLTNYCLFSVWLNRRAHSSSTPNRSYVTRDQKHNGYRRSFTQAMFSPTCCSFCQKVSVPAPRLLRTTPRDPSSTSLLPWHQGHPAASRARHMTSWIVKVVGVVLRWTGGRSVGGGGGGGGGEGYATGARSYRSHFQRLGLVTRLLIKGN